jgi:hypothetical protein
VRPSVLLGQRVPPGPGLARLKSQLAHEPADQLRAAPLAAAHERLVDAAVAVFLVVGNEEGPYLQFQEFPSLVRC